jgi:hypothetical protein
MLFLALMLGAVTSQLAPEAVTVRVTGDCPSAVAIDQRLRKLVVPVGPGRAADVAHVEVVESRLAVALYRATGEVIADKRLPLQAGCAQRAESVAIVLAAWEAQLGDHAAPVLVPPVTPPPAGDATAAPPAPAVTPVLVAAAPAARPAGWVFSPGGSLLASIDRDDTALAATAEVAVSRRSSPFALAGGAMFVSSHTAPVAPGSGSWRRFGVVLDARGQARRSRLWGEARAGLALTVLNISGSGLPENGSGVALDPGAVVAVRLGLVQAPAIVWLELGATVWPRRQTVEVRGGGAVDLPLVDVLVGLGFSLQRSP